MDAVDLKGVEPTVTLGKLVSLVREVDWDVSLLDLELLWSGDEQDGPWLMSLDRAARDTLASISNARVLELSAQWGRTEELAWSGPLSDDEMLPVIEKVATLAQRARDAGEDLYLLVLPVTYKEVVPGPDRESRLGAAGCSERP